jgi:DNA polymerase-1
MSLLPNVRKIFVPDPGKMFFDADLDRADLQVVVWEAADDGLKAALREGVDIHALNAKDLFNLSCGVGEVKKLFPAKRDMSKRWVHGTNYGGSARTMAISCGLTVHESDRLQRRWFSIHPGIERWHIRTAADLRKTRSVKNRFGYRRFYFDRTDSILPEALAWVPQSTVACVINEVWIRIERDLPQVEILLQVHDSLCGQFPVNGANETLAQLREISKVVIPYPDPLVIPMGFKTSQVSWGDCE